MLTADEQAEIVRLAERLATAQSMNRQRLHSGVISQRRFNELMAQHRDRLRDYLKECGDVPMPRLPHTTTAVAADR